MITSIINSKTLRATVFFTGYIAAYIALFGNYNQLGGGLVTLGAFLFVITSAFTVTAVCLEKKRGVVLKQLVKTDMGFLAVTVIFMFAAGTVFIRWYKYDELVAFAPYSASYVFMLTAVSHIKDRTLLKSFYFINFFKTYRKSGVGLSVFALTGIIIFAMYRAVRNFEWHFEKYTLGLLFAYAAFAAVCYLYYYLTTLSRLYDKAVEERLKSERVKIELISNVSHDLRTPLTSIISYIDLIKRLGLENPSLAEYLAVLEKKSERMKTLASDLIEASKAGAGDIKMNRAEIDLAELTGQVAGEFDSLMSEAGLNFVFNHEKVLIKADGEHLCRVMENVFGNAVKYSLSGTRVYCFVGVLDGKAVFSLKNVSKEPLNISPDELTERFVRGDSSRTDEGSGLGLYIAKALAELMGARFIIGISGDLFEAGIEFPLTEN